MIDYDMDFKKKTDQKHLWYETTFLLCINY